MAGELWRGTVQIGKETAYGTGVPATRILYARDPSMSIERDPRPYRFATTTRDNLRALTLGPTRVGGTLPIPVSAEIIEMLLIGVQGAVTPTGAGTVKTWTFKPSATLDSATIEWHDGARVWEAAGCYANELRIAGSVGGENILTSELFAKSLVIDSLTGSLTHRVPDVFEGWESEILLGAAGSIPSSATAGLLISWDVAVRNGLSRRYLAANTLNAAHLNIGELEVEATLVVEASSAAAATEYGNWNSATSRVVRLRFGNNKVIESTNKEFVAVDLPGKWTAVDLSGEDEGARTYQLSLTAVYDVTLATALQFVVQTARATAWA